ncbi:Flp family type IVb pilin [Paraburkholderia sp. DHOC27]|uniref:Flp family type IVb pilin n=1 Tax=Paraburkholderia sp. DHOC27 TaxID=2303330 RepID=UPI000E3DBFC3|nr:Flp family type IVb pilin [Paraburkholderia sp. DHOC27]RFU47984.1 Flp family type IVb pilin [Paraburkholderia sp. DHOC27]
MKNLTIKFLRETKGVTALEYGLIAGLIAVAIAASVTTLGTDLSSVFTTVAGKLPTTSGG